MIGCVNWESIKPLSEPSQRRGGDWIINNLHSLSSRYAVLGILTICLSALAGCMFGSPQLSLAGTRPLAKIGLAAPFEGLGRPLGYEALTGVKLAVAERNMGGGVAGYMVELVALNDFGEPDEARLQAREFSADPAIMGVITGWDNETARASLPIYRQAGLAVAVPWSVFPELADRESGIVLVASDTRQVGKALAESVVAASPKRLAVVGDELAAARYAESLEAFGLKPLLVSLPDSLDSERFKEWATQLVSDARLAPDALVLTTDGALAGEVLLALRDLSWQGLAFGGAEAGSSEVVNVGGGATDTLLLVSPAPAGVNVVRGRGASPVSETARLEPRAVAAYDATQVLLDAMELAIRQDGYPSRQGIVTALPQVRRQGLTGTIAFDVAGRRVDAPVWLYNITHNEYPGQLLASPEATSGE
jgi:branched-chain amino acid transport system substrate-binding protein